MSNIADGGQAFPRTPGTTGGPLMAGSAGMTLRDYFAAKAMASIIQKGEYAVAACDDAEVLENLAQVARGAYAYADAMLKERAK